MDEVVAALIAVPTILLGILLTVSTVEGADRRRQLYLFAHRGATAAAIAVPSDATPQEARAGVVAGASAVTAASTICADLPTVVVEYYDRRIGGWMDPARYQGNLKWPGASPQLDTVRVSVTCLPLPGPLPAMTSPVTSTSRKPLTPRAQAVEEAPASQPVTDRLQEER